MSDYVKNTRLFKGAISLKVSISKAQAIDLSQKSSIIYFMQIREVINTEVIRRVSRAAIVAALSTTALSGCLSNTGSTSPAVKKASNKETPILRYLDNPSRIDKVLSGLRYFDKQIVAQTKIPDSKVGPFDEMCHGSDFAESPGLVSQGYKPKPGDTCDIITSYDSTGDFASVSAGELIGKNDHPSGNFVSAGTSSSDGCTTYISYDTGNHVWLTQGPYSNQPIENISVREAKIDDNYALNCLRNTVASITARG